MSADRHEPFRTLLAERMDAPLQADDAAQLKAHLDACPACRSVARDYAADRERMRNASAPEPPRDLWARTSAALDREVADHAERSPGPGFPGPGRQLRLAMASMVTALVILALTGGQLLPEAPTGLATATPFAIPAEAVSYVGVADGALTFYRAHVAQVCPLPRLDCADGPDGEAVVTLGAPVHAREMAMNGTGQLFIAGQDDLGAEVFSIVTLPPDGSSDAVDEPSSDPSPDPSPSTEAVASGAPTETRNPDVDETDPPTPEPTDGGDVLPSPSSDAGDPALGPSISPPPGPMAVATSQSILSDALATGAAAAWSPDGTTLAFSAMPADRSQGSDVYIWKPGDEQAQPITDDHASYFASWSDTRIVASRTYPGTSDSPDAPTVTAVIDPDSGEVRPVDLERAWLPTVDPTGRFVVYWRGRVTTQAGLASADDGRLYIADWTSLDPWPAPRTAAGRDATPGDGAEGDANGGTAQASPDTPAASETAPTETVPTETAPDTPEASDAVTSSGDESPNPSAGTEGDGQRPSTTPDPDPADATDTAEATSEPAEAADGTTAPADESAAPRTDDGVSASADRFVPERPRAVSGQTHDWVVRWTSDGDAYAVWTGEPGSRMIGSLMVRSTPSADAPTGTTFVDRVRASRSFGLGHQRIAWVAPLANGDGDLWVSVWGGRGQGSVKLRRLDSLEAVPAY